MGNLTAGLNDWGGVSPVTPDHVNPEAHWPHLQDLADKTASTSKLLVERLAVYPSYVQNASEWQDPQIATYILQASDSEGFARVETWSPGAKVAIPALDQELATRKISQITNPSGSLSTIKTIIAKALAAEALTEAEVTRLFQACGDEFSAV